MLKDKIKQMLELPDEVLEQAYNILYGEGTNYAHKSEHIRNLLTMNRALLATLPSVYEMLNFLESHLPEQEQDFKVNQAMRNQLDKAANEYANWENWMKPQGQDLTDLRRSVSQCTTVEYCKGWNDAIKAVQEQQNRVDKNIEEANEALRKRVEPVNPELYKAMVGEQEQGLAVIFDRYSTDKDSHYPLMDFYGFQQAVLELQQPKEEEICEYKLRSNYYNDKRYNTSCKTIVWVPNGSPHTFCLNCGKKIKIKE